MYEVVFSSHFDRKLKRLLKKNPDHIKKFEKVVNLMRKDLNYSSLRLHKLSGYKNWSVSVGSDLRIIFRWRNKKIFCTDIGTHDEVY